MIKGIAIDLQFTLVYLEHFSLDGWFSLLNQGFSEVMDYLQELGYLFEPKKLQRTLRRVRNKYFTKYITGEDQQYFTEEILTDTFARNNIHLSSKEELVKCSQLYHQFEIPAWVPFPKIKETLEALSQKFTLGLITNSSEYVTSEILKLHNLTEFSFIFNNARKPRLTSFKQFQEFLNVPFEQLIMIGDDLTTDIIPAQDLGMKTIHSYRGYEYVLHHATLDVVPDRKITQFQGVIDAIESLSRH